MVWCCFPEDGFSSGPHWRDDCTLGNCYCPRESSRELGNGFPNHLEPDVKRVKDIFMLGEPKPVSWVIEQVLPAGLTLIAGQPGAGKSWMALEMARSVASGTPFMGVFQSLPGVVLYIDVEAGPITHRRAWHMGLKDYPVVLREGFNIEDEDETEHAYWQELASYCKERNQELRLIIIDSFSMAHSRKENDAAEMSSVFQHLRDLASGMPETAIVLIHHTRKPSEWTDNLQASIRGSTAIVAQTDVAYVVKVAEGAPEHVLMPVKFRLCEAPNPFAFILEPINENAASLKYLGKPNLNLPTDVLQACKDKVMSILSTGEERKRKELIDAVKGKASRATMEAAISTLEHDGVIYKPRRGWYKKVEVQQTLKVVG